MGQKKTTGWQAGQLSAVDRLARFFPAANPVKIPVTVSTRSARDLGESEFTMIEFGTPHEVLFGCRMPLEFAERIWLRNRDGSRVAEAWVVALHYQAGEAAFAARFAHDVENWIPRP